MVIQWFPGHMTKALRVIEKELKVVDVIIYVLDSRAPYSCQNPKLNSIIGNKKIVYVLNKCDLVNKQELDKWVQYFSSNDSVAVALNATASNSCKVIVGLIKKLMKDKIDSYKAKNINKIIRAMVVGVPNSGKSTLVNNLCGVARAVTGNRPGVTKGKQWVTIDNGIEVLDMPGTLWPSFEDQNIAKNLAYIGSIKDDVLDINDLAFNLLRDFKDLKRDVLCERYNIEITDEQEIIEIFDDICFARKCVLKGNEPDYDRCARMIVDDFRKGKFGKIILDDYKRYV